ncbi:MAG TPA: hypothetical protein VG248_15925 [Caulobacteraceae bacterium]|nr:hypothetical protein [Caulobacteraceae bacterium]
MGSAPPWRAALGLAAALALGGAAQAAASEPYPAMAPLSQYLMGDRAAEIALARSAAPASVSGSAEVLVLEKQGFVRAAAGSNGFVCMVQRAWSGGLADPEFWNPRQRAPICFNPEAARSVLPFFQARTQAVLAGVSREQIIERQRAEIAAGHVPAPAAGSLTYMMSKQGYLGDVPKGPWRPHLMFFFAPMATADWGADLPGSPVSGAGGGAGPYTVFFVPLARWSDGSPDTAPPDS